MQSVTHPQSRFPMKLQRLSLCIHRGDLLETLLESAANLISRLLVVHLRLFRFKMMQTLLLLTSSNIRVSYADILRQASATSEFDAFIQRQRRSQLEARRINALAEEIRGMVGSPGNNPPNSMNTQAQSVPDLSCSSVLGRNYCNTTIGPTERRSHLRAVPSTTSEPPFSRFQGLDPSSFTPGPFRNTVQQLFNERRHVQRRPDPSSVPPTIPPLSFEDNDLSSTLHQRILLHQLRRPSETAQATTQHINSRYGLCQTEVRELLQQQQAMNLRDEFQIGLLQQEG